MQGLHNNNCFIIPDWDMVIVRLGEDKTVLIDEYEEFLSLMDQAIMDDTETSERTDVR
jgi:hypothetical protein